MYRLPNNIFCSLARRQPTQFSVTKNLLYRFSDNEEETANNTNKLREGSFFSPHFISPHVGLLEIGVTGFQLPYWNRVPYLWSELEYWYPERIGVTLFDTSCRKGLCRRMLSNCILAESCDFFSIGARQSQLKLDPCIVPTITITCSILLQTNIATYDKPLKIKRSLLTL
jgi:hypothetical protein